MGTVSETYCAEKFRDLGSCAWLMIDVGGGGSTLQKGTKYNCSPQFSALANSKNMQHFSGLMCYEK